MTKTFGPDFLTYLLKNEPWTYTTRNSTNTNRITDEMFLSVICGDIYQSM
jgi:hypothetical protein